MTQGTADLPPRNALAVTSLALGVTGMILSPLGIGGLMGLVAVGMGVAALRRPVRRAMATGGVITGILAMLLTVAAVAAYVLIPLFLQGARQNMALRDLRQLDQAAQVHAARWNGAAPENMGQLITEVPNLERALRDPRLSRVPRRVNLPWGGPPADMAKAVESNSDFYYAAPGTLADPRLITFYDKAPPGAQRLVAFADGHVAGFKPGSPELRAAVEANNAARSERHLPPLPLALDGPPPEVKVPATAAATLPEE